MLIELNKPPKTTIFSINPDTNLPYLDIKRAESLIAYHILNRASHMLLRDSLEDLIQDLMVQMCTQKFDPALSSAKTFATLIIQTKCGNMSAGTYRNKHTVMDGVLPKVFGETFQVSEEGHCMSNLDIVPNEVTALDYMLAEEIVEQHWSENAKLELHGEKTKPYPSGYTGCIHQFKGYPTIKDSDTKLCLRCKKVKNLKTEYGSDKTKSSGKTTWCRVCNNELARMYREARAKVAGS
jgi:hypothetical protein